MRTQHLMRRAFVAAVGSFTFFALLAPIAPLSAAEAVITAADGKPADLVKAALRTELDGPSAQRAVLLEQALASDPNFAPARWQSGFVRLDNEWLKVDEVARRARSDEHLADYRKRRDAMVDTADNHRTLARWCHKNKLPDEERVHWAKVLEFEHEDAEAIAALVLQLYEGRLLTRAQIEREKKLAGERRAAMLVWQPKFMKWRTAIERGNPKQLDEALRGFKGVSDPGAIPALEAIFAVNGPSPKTDELNRLLIETVGRMNVPEATMVLLRRSVVADSLVVRTQAADELKKRPMHAYVPMLIAAMPGSLKTRFNIFVLPNGMVSHEHELFIDGRNADYSITYQSMMNPADLVTAILMTPMSVNRELGSAAAIEGRARAIQEAAQQLRDRISFVLERTTGFANADDPQLWEKQYNDYNGWSTPPAAKPTYSRTYSYIQAYNQIPMNETTTTVRYNHSCFPAGTSILTLAGSRPIEEIKIGDKVLSQDVATGELAYKPVQATTLRPTTPLIRISIGPNSLLATPGHPFWVVGRGWSTAKNLHVGEALHGLGGASYVDALEEVRAVEVYNLVISESHNYFVGSSKLLVHDNSPLEGVPGEVPGLAYANTSSQ